MICPGCKGYNFHVHKTEIVQETMIDQVHGRNVRVVYRCFACGSYWDEIVWMKGENNDLSKL